MFNEYFASQCTPINNTSTLPPLVYRKDQRLNDFNFNEDDIFSIIKALDPNKAHGWDGISIRMIKLLEKTITLLETKYLLLF